MGMYPGALVILPPWAIALIWIGVASTASLGKYGAPQSPSVLQSEGTLALTKRTIGAEVDAPSTLETGASDTDSCATAGAATLGSVMNVGNCAVSCTAGLAPATSYRSEDHTSEH